MKRLTAALALPVVAAVPLLAAPTTSSAAPVPTTTATATTATTTAAGGLPATYRLQGDEGGSKFEGIGADPRRGLFYVSETTGGEIHRGHALRRGAQQWLAGDGTDGRYTARGVKVDGAGRVYVAGGPNGIGTGRPDLWVYSPDGALLAALRAPADDVFLNDVAIGPDGAAYFTNSNAPQVFRVARGADGWGVELWADATGTVPRADGFNLGGLVVTADRRALVVAQGNAGALWRVDLRSRAVTPVDTGGTDLVDADGLVRQGGRLLVVRNVSRSLATLSLSADGRRARLLSQQATDPTRVLTTAASLWGRMLFVDSKFDESVAAPPYEVVTRPVAR